MRASRAGGYFDHCWLLISTGDLRPSNQPIVSLGIRRDKQQCEAKRQALAQPLASRDRFIATLRMVNV